ncbi:hypothetical protein [Nocardia sp. alder85J]|uniref:hypothetical protein n=1 Tax=Nocardia sp. alder85J TaxID=2862949 RepID=UPI001CD2E095|nr:hypothetical protein [Nocardia sp. alder85J]MCX4099212.1 hypothetical protein [Nocardia sp. alder85J]
MNTGPGGYSASHIRKTTWGEFLKLDDGRWKTTWKLVFETAQDTRSVEIYGNDNIGFRAELKTSGGVDAELLVFTAEQAMSAIYYPPTFKSFGMVNDLVGELKTIEGHPKEWYAPFRLS